MKLHEQRDELARAIELALPELRSGPPLGAFGIAREDCALVHMDYFMGIHVAAHALADALATVRGTTVSAIHQKFGAPETPCDCQSCVGEAAAQQAEAKHRTAYTNVKEWRS